MKYLLVLILGLFISGCTVDSPLPVKHEEAAVSEPLPLPVPPKARILWKDHMKYNCYR